MAFHRFPVASIVTLARNGRAHWGQTVAISEMLFPQSGQGISGMRVLHYHEALSRGNPRDPRKCLTGLSKLINKA